MLDCQRRQVSLRRILLSITTLAAIVTHCGAATSAGEGGVVRVHFVNAQVDTTVRDFAVEPVGVITVNALEFELSISLEGAEIEFLRAGSVRSDLKVQLQYETSVSIMDDGPHLDLLEWKHYTSEWLDLRFSESGRAVLPVFTPDQQSRFPEVDTAELRAAVSAAGGDRWSNLLNDTSSVHEPPVGIGISTIRLRFTEGSGVPEARQYVIEFPFPMGC